MFSDYGGCRPKFGRMAISLFCSVIGVQGLSGGHAEWSFIFCSMSKVWWVSAKVRPNGHLLLRLFVRCRVVVFVVLLGRYLCCGVVYIIYYLLIHFVYWNLQKKIEIQNKRVCCPIRIFGTNYFDVCFFKHFLFTHFVMSCDIIVTFHIF